MTGPRCTTALHAGESGKSGASGHPEQNRLRLIVERVGGDKMRGLDRPGETDQHIVAGLARRRLDAGRGFRALPNQEMRREPECLGLFGNLRCNTIRSGLQAVVDGCDGERRQALLARERRGEIHQGNGIRSSGNGKEDPAGLLERCEAGSRFINRKRRRA